MKIKDFFTAGRDVRENDMDSDVATLLPATREDSILSGSIDRLPLEPLESHASSSTGDQPQKRGSEPDS